MQGLLTETSLVDVAIERLRLHEPDEGYFLAFSGGKDSQIIYRLAGRARERDEAREREAAVRAQLRREQEARGADWNAAARDIIAHCDHMGYAVVERLREVEARPLTQMVAMLLDDLAGKAAGAAAERDRFEAALQTIIHDHAEQAKLMGLWEGKVREAASIMLGWAQMIAREAVQGAEPGEAGNGDS